jgi:RNA polymerase sigma factor (sigma-70 family)
MRAPDSEALRAMERDLRRRLRAHRLSESFVDRHAEDALQRGVIEYLRAREAGTEIREPTGFVLQAAFRRAIDELRREARRLDGADVERLMDEVGDTSPSAEEIAVDDMSAAELRAAIDTLPAEERQALCLHYFEELSDARSAKLLYCSERTFRRRLRKALTDLAELLGGPAPEPGSHRALEVGLSSWVSLRGARVVLSSHPLEHLSAAVEGVRDGFTRAIDRVRNPAAQLAGEGAPERLGAIAGGPAGKVIGGCAGAAVICALSGVVGPGLHLGGSAPRSSEHRAAGTSAAQAAQGQRPLVVRPHPSSEVKSGPKPSMPSPAASPSPRPRHRTPHRSAVATERHSVSATRQQSEEEQVEEQVSGIARAAAEAETGTSGSAGESASVQQSAPANTASESSGGVAGKPSSIPQRSQVETEFGFER